MPRPRPGPRRARFASLDGLRGYAALIVLLHHIALTSPALATAYEIGHRPHGLAAIAAYTPVHLLWSGTEAVYLFFVLSGFVLMLPLTSDRRFSWLGYYPQRAIRLYLPILASVALAAFWLWTVPRHVVTGASWWQNVHAFHASFHSLTRDFYVTDGVDFANSPLWSLRWEVWFSLALPVYAVVALRLVPGRGLALKVTAAAALAAWWRWHGNLDLQYLPIFLIGAFLAVHRDQLRDRITAASHRTLVAVAIVAVLALDAPWYASASGTPSPATASVLYAVQLLACATVLALFCYWRPLVRAGESCVGSYVGSRSFSLYLVHEPLLVSIAQLVGPHHLALTAAIAIPSSLVLAEVFHRVVERPSRTLSHLAAGTLSRRRTAPRHAAAVDRHVRLGSS